MKNIAIMSDAYGLTHPEIIGYISDADLILHARNIGHIDVIKRLEDIASPIALAMLTILDGKMSVDIQEFK